MEQPVVAMPFYRSDGIRAPRRPQTAVLGRSSGSQESWQPACMTEQEYDAWQTANDAVMGRRAERPCADCPWLWREQRRAEGCCNSTE